MEQAGCKLVTLPCSALIVECDLQGGRDPEARVTVYVDQVAIARRSVGYHHLIAACKASVRSSPAACAAAKRRSHARASSIPPPDPRTAISLESTRCDLA